MVFLVVVHSQFHVVCDVKFAPIVCTHHYRLGSLIAVSIFPNGNGLFVFMLVSVLHYIFVRNWDA